MSGSVGAPGCTARVLPRPIVGREVLMPKRSAVTGDGE
jgi:hypothetical protein